MSSSEPIFPHWKKKIQLNAYMWHIWGNWSRRQMHNYCALYWKFSGCYEKVKPGGHGLHKILHRVVAFLYPLPLCLCLSLSPSLFQMDSLLVPIVFEWAIILSVLCFKMHQYKLCGTYAGEKINLAPKQLFNTWYISFKTTCQRQFPSIWKILIWSPHFRGASKRHFNITI